MKELSKTRFFTGKQFEHFRQKKQKQLSRPFENIRWNTETQNQHLKIALVNNMKWTR